MINRLTFGVPVAAIALPLITLIAQPTSAIPQAYEFSVKVTRGALEGLSFGGNFCYDDDTIQSDGIETIGVADGLGVEMTFFNQAFTASDDIDYPDFPTLILEDGHVHRLDFWVEPGPRGNWWDLPGWDVTVTPTADVPSCWRESSL